MAMRTPERLNPRAANHKMLTAFASAGFSNARSFSGEGRSARRLVRYEEYPGLLGLSACGR